MRLCQHMLAAQILLLCASPAFGMRPAEDTPRPESAPAFAARALAEPELAAIVGAGLVRPMATRDLAQDDWQSVSRQNGSILQATFDNWFADVGNPMILANIASAP